MKELVPKDEYGVFADMHNTARVDSLFVAQAFEKRHDHVLRDITKITAPKSGLSEEFTKINFTADYYRDATGRKLPCYQMTRDGFTMLVMGYTGKKAMRFKEMYIRRFNEMEEFIRTLASAKQDFPILTENIKLLHQNPKPYHYSNECDMITKIATGKTARQIRAEHGQTKRSSIRTLLTERELKAIEILQKVDIGLMLSVKDFKERRGLLSQCAKERRLV